MSSLVDNSLVSIEPGTFDQKRQSYYQYYKRIEKIDEMSEKRENEESVLEAQTTMVMPPRVAET